MRFIGFLFFVLVSTTCALPTSPSQRAPSDSGREIEVGPRAAPPKKLKSAGYTFSASRDDKIEALGNRQLSTYLNPFYLCHKRFATNFFFESVSLLLSNNSIRN
ncbi:hypothetical protein F5880DRAFT_1618560 [Lentinula raphanica]|nr:hypothetical protein F5880DRAFT_1618560 [Lentinula raphanica]